jgi:hypothetical protein
MLLVVLGINPEYNTERAAVARKFAERNRHVIAAVESKVESEVGLAAHYRARQIFPELRRFKNRGVSRQ